MQLNLIKKHSKQISKRKHKTKYHGAYSYTRVKNKI